jgi:hypothetical protein
LGIGGLARIAGIATSGRVRQTPLTKTPGNFFGVFTASNTPQSCAPQSPIFAATTTTNDRLLVHNNIAIGLFWLLDHNNILKIL